MDLLHDLTEFRELACRLPALDFVPGEIGHPRLSFFAASHDADEIAIVSATTAELRGDGPFRQEVAAIDADLRLYELAIAEPAVELKEHAAARTIAFGMTAIEPGPDIFCLAALCEVPQILKAIQQGLQQGREPLQMLAACGGRDTAALLGAIMAARMAGLPVILDGAQACAAALVLNALQPGAASHCAALGSFPDDEILIKLPITDPLPYSLTAAIRHCRARQLVH